MSELYENTGKLLGLAFFSSLFIGMTLFFYAVFNDYVMFSVYEVVQTMEASGVIGSWVATMIVFFQETILFLIPNILDILWAMIFLLFAFNFLQSAYFAKREGYFSALSFLTFGIMVLLFVLSIFITLAQWFQIEFVARVLPTLAYATPLFSFYLSNIGIINTLLIAIAIILNFIDLDISSFRFRKEKENVGNELS